MPKPNFFCGLAALQWLLEHEPKSEQDDIDLTVDLIEAPYLFVYTSEAEAWNLKVLMRGELYDHEKGSGVEKGNIRVDKKTGQGSGQTTDPLLRDNLGAFFEACRRISRYICDENLQPMYAGLDPEQAGVMLEVSGDRLKARTVAGAERPEMMCSTLFGGAVMMRPYMDDFMDRSMTEMMPLEERIEKAESGDKFAIAKLAQAYLNGDDEVEQDPEKAAYWYRKEADLQDSEGAFNLGLLYAKGFGVERDFVQAAEWMEKAAAWGDRDGIGPAKTYRAMAENLKKAEAGDAEAMAELAESYMALGGSLDQAGSGKDYAECLKWAQMAVDAGCAAGCWPLALAYEHGRGVAADKQKATELYRKGAEGGHAPCQHSYGCRLMTGEGVGKDTMAAKELFEKAADQGYALAYKALGHMYETGEGVEIDFDKELDYFEKACQADPSDAEFLRHVGYQYTNLLEDKNKWLYGVERAAHWLRAAADRGDRVAASGAGMYEQILALYKQGKIAAGTSLDKCMSILSKAGEEDKKERERKDREADEQRRRKEEAAERRKAEEKNKREKRMQAERELRESEQREREEQQRKKKQAEEDRIKRYEDEHDRICETIERLRPVSGLFSSALNNCAYVGPYGDAGFSGLIVSIGNDSDPDDVSAMHDLRGIALTWDGVIGLKKNGFCVTTRMGRYMMSDYGYRAIGNWQDIRKIAAGDHHVVGLRYDGTCVGTKLKSNAAVRYEGQGDVEDWDDIVDIVCGGSFTAGLRRDGSVRIAGVSGDFTDTVFRARAWKDILLLYAFQNQLIGLKRDGSVVQTGNLDLSTLSAAKDIVSLACYADGVAALQSDGNVIGVKKERNEKTGSLIYTGGDAVGLFNYDLRELLILKKDGTFKEIGGYQMKSDVRLFNDFSDYEKNILGSIRAREEEIRLEKEQREAAANKRREEEALRADRKAKGLCQYCGGELEKKLFGWKCKECGRKKDY